MRGYFYASVLVGVAAVWVTAGSIELTADGKRAVIAPQTGNGNFFFDKPPTTAPATTQAAAGNNFFFEKDATFRVHSDRIVNASPASAPTTAPADRAEVHTFYFDVDPTGAATTRAAATRATTQAAGGTQGGWKAVWGDHPTTDVEPRALTQGLPPVRIEGNNVFFASLLTNPDPFTIRFERVGPAPTQAGWVEGNAFFFEKDESLRSNLNSIEISFERVGPATARAVDLRMLNGWQYEVADAPATAPTHEPENTPVERVGTKTIVSGLVYGRVVGHDDEFVEVPGHQSWPQQERGKTIKGVLFYKGTLQPTVYINTDGTWTVFNRETDPSTLPSVVPH